MTRLSALAAAALGLAAAAPRPGPSRSAQEPPAGFTGGFGEPTCVHCHLGSDPNAYGGSVALEGLPERYRAGRAYTVTVRLVAEETDVAGFQLTSRWADGPKEGFDAGVLTPVDGRTATKDSLGVTYAHQTGAGARAAADRSGSSWTLTWTAPEAGGTIDVHVAANSGNADESPLGDLVYTHRATLGPEHRR